MSSKVDYYPLIRSHPHNCREKNLINSSSYRAEAPGCLINLHWGRFINMQLELCSGSIVLSLPWNRLSTWDILQVPRFFQLRAFGISARNASHQEVLLTTNATYMSVRRETKEWNKVLFLFLVIVNVCLPKWAPIWRHDITSCHPLQGPCLKQLVLFWQIRMSLILVKRRCAVTVLHLLTSLRGCLPFYIGKSNKKH